MSVSESVCVYIYIVKDVYMIYILANKGPTLTCLAKQNRQTKTASAAWIILNLAYGTYSNYHGIEKSLYMLRCKIHQM